MKQWQLTLSSLIVGLMVSGESQASAERFPNSAMTLDQCSARAGGRNAYPSISGSAGVYLIGDREEICIWQLGQERSTLTVPNANQTQSYPRDNLIQFYPLATAPNDASTMRIKHEILIPSQESRTPAWRMGQEVLITLPQHTEQANGQTVYVLNEYLGLRLWASLLEGPLSSFRSNPRRFVNDGQKYGGNNSVPGDYYGRNRTDAFNANFNLDAELVLLKTPPPGQDITVPRQQIGEVRLHSANYARISGKIDFPIFIDPINIRFVPRSCSYSGATERVVKMNKIGVGHFHNRDEVYGGETVLNLNCGAEANVDSYITFTDAADNSNTSNALSLSPEAVNAGTKGLKVRLYKDNETTPISFGPIEYSPSTTAILKKDYQKQVGTKAETAGNAPKNYSIKLTAKYLKTGEISPGPVKAATMFTFSYY